MSTGLAVEAASRKIKPVSPQRLIDLVNDLHHRSETYASELRAKGCLDVYDKRRLAGIELARNQRIQAMGADKDLTVYRVRDGFPVVFNQYDRLGNVVRVHRAVERVAIEPHLNTITHEWVTLEKLHDKGQISDVGYKEEKAKLEEDEGILMGNSRTYPEAHQWGQYSDFLEARKALEAWVISKDPLRAFSGVGFPQDWIKNENWLLAARTIEGPWRDSFYSRPLRRGPDQRRELVLV